MVQVQTHRQAGFTLIELVMVIVILGILSAFALPRFADLSGDARAASINGLSGSLKSASAIVHAQALVDNKTSGAVTLEGQSIALVNGYPDNTAIATAANVDTANDYDANTTAGTTAIFSIKGYTPTSGNCNVTFTEAGAGGAATVVADTGGC